MYARPRYFANGKGFIIIRSYIGSFSRKTKANKSTSTTKTIGQRYPEEISHPCPSVSNSGTAKFSSNHFPSLAMETEVVPFGAHGSEEQVPAPVVDANEDEPKVDALSVNEDPNLGDTRYEMLLAG